jgi:YVTN family beta-propeller protein
VNSLSNDVSVVDVADGKEVARVPVGRDPRFAALTPDGKRLLVANGLDGTVSVVDTRARQVVETLPPSPGQGGAGGGVVRRLLRQICVTPDGSWAAVAHGVPRDKVPTTQLRRGWLHTNGFSALNLGRAPAVVTFLLDRLNEGAANPYGAAFTHDGKRLLITHAGIHQLSIIELAALRDLLASLPREQWPRLADDLTTLPQRRVFRRVPAGGLGPRALAISPDDRRAYVVNYYSDTLSVLRLPEGDLERTISLGPETPLTPERQGEIAFHNGRLSFQGFLSCVSCHQEEATMDGLNWDLMNDGVGNPKNAKSLIGAFETPPSMWSQAREDLAAATAAGFRFQGYMPDPEVAANTVAYLRSLRHAPSPYRQPDGSLIPAAQRGEAIFNRADVGCAACHPAPLYTHLKMLDVGTGNGTEGQHEFDTPSLRECYRTAPYLHDGRAETFRDVLTKCNPDDRHGRTSHLSEEELNDLIEYLKAL